MVLELREQEGRKRGRREMEREGRRAESEGQGVVTGGASSRGEKNATEGTWLGTQGVRTRLAVKRMLV